MGDYYEHCARDLARFVPLDIDLKRKKGCYWYQVIGHRGEVADGPANWHHGIELGFPGAVCSQWVVAYMRVEEQGNR